MNIPYVMKKCNKCGRWLVASTVNFHRGKSYKYGLQTECKKCRNNRHKQYYEVNKERELEKAKQYYEANREKIAERDKRRYEANREKELERCKQYYEANREKELEKNRRWRKANPEYDKQRYKDNRDSILEQQKQYKKSLQGKVVAFNARNKRRHKKEAQGTGATPEQWREMMEYFDWRCAYSGERLTDKTRSVDHIVAIDAGGDDMIWNMVPMTRSLNSSKWKKNMLEWYKEQDCYSEARLAKIYEWQEYARKKWEK